MLRQVKHGVKNLITWFPVIWQDQQWDHIFFLEVLQKKLELMEEYFRTRSHCVDGEKQADEIKYAILLIKRPIKDDYWEKKNGDYLKKQDYDELFKHIRKPLESWWD